MNVQDRKEIAERLQNSGSNKISSRLSIADGGGGGRSVISGMSRGLNDSERNRDQ
jgi:hypothetical protein